MTASARLNELNSNEFRKCNDARDFQKYSSTTKRLLGCIAILSSNCTHSPLLVYNCAKSSHYSFLRNFIRRRRAPRDDDNEMITI